jgi:hypothetical protein
MLKFVPHRKLEFKLKGPKTRGADKYEPAMPLVINRLRKNIDCFEVDTAGDAVGVRSRMQPFTSARR